jgi:hypothetical protein
MKACRKTVESVETAHALACLHETHSRPMGHFFLRLLGGQARVGEIIDIVVNGHA